MHLRVKPIALGAILLPIVLLIVMVDANGQVTRQNDWRFAAYDRMMDDFMKEKYAGVVKEAELIIEHPDLYSYRQVEDAYFYRCLAAVELFNKDAENLVNDFKERYPYSDKTIRASFYLGRYYFRKRKWDKALEVFGSIKKEELDYGMLCEYHFRLGYSYFELDLYDKAKPHFYEAMNFNDIFADAARYYYAFILYLEKDYSPALENFLKLQDNEKFAKVVPYYIIQIYYIQGKYRDVIKYYENLGDSIVPKRKNELYKYLAESYYYLKEYDKAISYYEEILSDIRRNREYSYNLAEAYRKTGKCQNSVEYYRYAIGENDSLSQIAYYNMGRCYIEMNRKEYARNVFKNAAELPFNSTLREEALYNYAKLSYELSFHPFNDAVLAIEKFLNEFPNSLKRDEMISYLISIYYTTKNYNAALASIERLKFKDIKILEIYQKIAYLQAIQLFNDQNYRDAIGFFDKSLQYRYDKNVYAQALYWKAESHYRLGEYTDAIKDWQNLLEYPAVINQEFYLNIYYQLGYAYWQLKKYNESIEWFRKFTAQSSIDIKKKCDAYNRIADGYFLQRKFEWALEYYEKNTFCGKYETDYAMYQSALCLGVVKNYDEKINILKSLVTQYPNSDYVDDALFQIAETYLVQGQQSNALVYLKKIYDEHRRSPYLAEVILKIGLVYYNQGKDDEALKYFKQAVEQFPSTEYAYSAIDKIKAIYLENNDVAGFENYVKQFDFIKINPSSLDSSSFYVAEKNYFDGDCAKAVSQLTAYLEKYPNGYFRVPALYYRADCEWRGGFVEEARNDLLKLWEMGRNRFSANVAERLAEIYRKENNWNKAEYFYKQLIELSAEEKLLKNAHFQLTQIYFEMNRPDDALKHADIYLKMSGSNEENSVQKIKLIKAKCLMEKLMPDQAESIFKELSQKNNAIGAESKYYLAFLKYQRGEYKKAEKDIFDFVKSSPGYEYWVTKSLILLADVYLGMNEIFQAKQTLQSVVDNTKYDDLKEIAQEKLDIINEKERLRIRENGSGENPIEEINLER